MHVNSRKVYQRPHPCRYRDSQEVRLAVFLRPAPSLLMSGQSHPMISSEASRPLISSFARLRLKSTSPTAVSNGLRATRANGICPVAGSSPTKASPMPLSVKAWRKPATKSNLAISATSGIAPTAATLTSFSFTPPSVNASLTSPTPKKSPKPPGSTTARLSSCAIPAGSAIRILP